MSAVAHMTVEEVEAAGGYSVILADPAWQYAQGGRGAAENHYTTTALERMCALPVKRIAAPAAVVFMWATWPCLPDALALGTAWGFEYKTVGFVWVKYHEGSGKRCVGGGFWTRANTEFCLVFVRGKNHPKRLDTTEARAVRQLIETEPAAVTEGAILAPRGEHSAKPPEARERIVTLLGDVARIELFARDRAEGWDAWGDQVPGGSDILMGESPEVH